jgi:2-methylcitrate dehydratase PrpD
LRSAIAQRVELQEDPAADAVYPKQFACRVELHVAGGAVHRAATHDAHGTPGDPCTIEEQVAKFMRLGELSERPVALPRVVEVVRKLESLQSIRELTRLL